MSRQLHPNSRKSTGDKQPVDQGPRADKRITKNSGKQLDNPTRLAMEQRFSQQPPQLAQGASLQQKRQSGFIQTNQAGEQQADRMAAGMNPATSTSTDSPGAQPQRHVDFSDVRIHDDASAAKLTGSLNAHAITNGNDILFNRQQYTLHTPGGQRLLAHELTHVVQQRQGGRSVQAKLATNYHDIQKRLSYKVFLDWVITDQEAREALAMLEPLDDRDLADTVAAMDRDGLVERLLQNLSDEDREASAVLLARIQSHRSVKRSAERIIDLLSRGLFDWAVTDQDAIAAFHTLMGLGSQQIRSVVAKMVNKGVFDTLLEELPDSEKVRFAAFIERLKAIRDEFTGLVSSHVKYLRGKKGGAGKTIKRRVDKTGYGGSKSKWANLSDDKKKEWREKADKAIRMVTTSVKGTDLEPILARSKLVFAPKDAEENNAYAYVRGVNELYFGTKWVKHALLNPVSVHQSIAHELGGHDEFGDTWSWQIMQGSLGQLTDKEKREAFKGGNSVYSAYGYLETEIYAELRELPYRVKGSGGDRPYDTKKRIGDVHEKQARIKGAFGPVVGKQIVIRLYYRVMRDPRVTDEAKELLRKEVQEVFSLFPIKEKIKP